MLSRHKVPSSGWRARIRDGSLPPRDRLPSERELCTRFGVSRVTVREGLRVLEAAGLVTIKVGAYGGAFVRIPSVDLVGEGLGDLLSISALTAGDITEARRVVELGALPLVLARATEADIDALFDLVDEGQAALAENGYSVDVSARFDARVAECAHNPALTMLVESFDGPLGMSLREASSRDPAIGRRGNDEHRLLSEAIRARGLATAREVLATHIGRTARLLSHTASGDQDAPAQCM